MTGARQAELTKAATLAFLDAKLKGDERAAEFLQVGLAVQTADVAVSVK